MKKDFLNEKKIIICCGSGGVGKTTLSAALALEAAHRGKKTIVLTIDPAKRLATAMGLDGLGYTPKEIITSPPLSGKLYAMMLDTKRTFDRLIEKYASDPTSRKSILNNTLYKHMSSMIAGSQEYMAMEKLYEIYLEDNYDLIILDTPPTRHALDFLDAPKKMINMTGNSLLKWFLKPGIFLGKTNFRLFRKSAERILSVFDRLAGFAFLHELSQMVSLMSGLLGGFQARAKAVYNLLREDVTGFLLVTSPSSVAIQDALYFHEKICEEELPFLGFIVNRTHHSLDKDFLESIRQDLNTLKPALREKIWDQVKNYNQLALRDQKATSLLKKMGGKKSFYASIPLLTADVHDLEGLQQLYAAMNS